MLDTILQSVWLVIAVMAMGATVLSATRRAHEWTHGFIVIMILAVLVVQGIGQRHEIKELKESILTSQDIILAPCDLETGHWCRWNISEDATTKKSIIKQVKE